MSLELNFGKMQYGKEKVIKKYEKDGLKRLVMAGISNTTIQATAPLSVILLQYLVDENGIVDRNQLRNEYASEVHWYGNSDSIKITPVKSLTDEHWKMDKIVGEHRFEQPFVCKVDTGYLTGYTPTVVTRDHKPIQETQVGRRDLIYRDLIKHPRTLLRLNKGRVQPKKTITNVCPLPFLYTNYYFWLRHTLPRLEGLEHYVSETGIQPKLLVRENPPRWIFETIQLLGFGDYELIEWNGEDLLIKDMIIPCARGMEYNVGYHNHGEDTFIQYWCPPPSALSWVRDRALANVTESARGKESKNVLISREDALSRRITNRSELVDRLEEYEFEEYILSNMTFEDQVGLFAGAKNIISPHGAGLANSIFSKESRVLEIFHAEKLKPTYNLISQCRCLDYNYSIEKTDGRDIVVDTDRIMNYIEEMK